MMQEELTTMHIGTIGHMTKPMLTRAKDRMTNGGMMLKLILHQPMRHDANTLERKARVQRGSSPRLVKPTSTPNKVVKKATNAVQATKKVEDKRGKVNDAELKISNKVQLKHVQISSMVHMNKPSATKKNQRLVRFDSDVSLMEDKIRASPRHFLCMVIILDFKRRIFSPIFSSFI